MGAEGGQTLSHYRLDERIGAGGIGEVYRARDLRLDRDVALKVLLPGTLGDDAARKRFRKEALALSRLNHPNIATVHDFDTQEGVDFLVMEFVAGETMDEKLRAHPLPEKEVARIGTQLGEGLAAAHSQGIVHRDLKPGNLRLMPDGRLKILDFGLAKLVGPTAATAMTVSLTEAQAPMGTLPYMAPEQLRGEPVDARSDIWAAGAVLYELATARRAFAWPDHGRVVHAILNETPPAPSGVNRRVSSDLDRVILKCLEKDPEDRYQSAKEIAVDLRRMGGLSVVSPALVAKRRPIWQHRSAIAAMAVVLLGALLAALNVGGWRDRLLGPATSPHIRSLAVLPLANLSRDPEQEYLADGMTEALIAELSKIGALKVISRTSVMQYKGDRKPLPQVARELGVDALIEGSVLREGSQVRVTVQLIQGATDRHLWADSYQRELQSILGLQGDLAQAIARQIKVEVSPPEQARLASAPLVNPAAHEAYLKALFFENEVGAWRKQLESLQQAVAIDPNYALAHAELASTYLNLGNSARLPASEAYPKGAAAALRALELDDKLAEAHFAYARLLHLYEWKFAEAGKEYQRAIELRPGAAGLRGAYAFYLCRMGQYEEAIAEAKRAQELDPLSLDARMSLGVVLHYSRRYDEGIAQYRKILKQWPDHFSARYQLARAYIAKRMYAEAIGEIRRLQEKYAASGFADMLASLAGVAYGFSGNRAEATRILNSLNEKRKREYVRPYLIAEIYIGLGEKDQALEWLEKAYEERDDWVVWFKCDPIPDGLRSDPGFQGLMRRVGLPS